MKKFFQSRFGRRLLCVPVMLALAVAAGFLLRGFVGPQSEMWKRSVFCIATFGTGLSALFFVLLGWWGFLAGYGLLLLRELPDLLRLPEPWDTVTYFALLSAVLVAAKLWKTRWVKKASNGAKAPAQTAPPDAPDEDEIDDSPAENTLLVHFSFALDYYQLIRTPGELRAYCVGGGWLRGIDESRFQDPKKPLRPTGRKDKTFPLDETLKITIKPYRNPRTDREELRVTLRSGRRLYRLRCLAKNREIRAFFFRCTGNCTEPRRNLPQEPAVQPNAGRVAVLRGVNIALCAASVLIDLLWLLLRGEYRLFGTLALLPLLIALALCCIFPNDTTLVEKKSKEKSDRASFLPALLLGSLLPAPCTLLRFDFLRWGRLALFSAVVFAVLLGAALLLTTEWRTRKSAILAVAFALLFYGLSFTGQVNAMFDDTEPTRCEAVVEEMRISTRSKGPDIYELTVVLPDGQTLELNVGKSFYEQTEVGDTVAVTIHRGALDIPYANVSR